VCHRSCQFPAPGGVILAVNGGPAATGTRKGKEIMTDQQAEIDRTVGAFYRTGWLCQPQIPFQSDTATAG